MKKFLLLLIPLLFTGFLARAELVDSTLYNFRDGTIYNNAGSADGSLVLLNTGTTVKYKNSTYGLDVKLDGEIKLAVKGSCTVQFLGSAYSSLSMKGVSETGGVNLGEQTTKVANDLTDTYDFVYDGPADTLVFTATGSGSDIYLPQMELIPEQPGADSIFTSAIKNVVYYYDFRDGSIVPNYTSFNGNYVIDTGLIKIEPGSSNAYGYNGSTHGSYFKTGNTITLQVGGNSYIKVGGDVYSSGTITASSSTGSFNVTSQAAKTSADYATDSSSVNFLYVGSAGNVTLAFTSTVYVPIIKVVPYPYDTTLTSYTQKSGAIMFNGDTINVTSGATSSDIPTLTVSGNGTVISATQELASVRTNLSGSALSTFTPKFNGNISSVNVSGDTLLVAYADSSSMPYGYKILVSDNSQTATALPGKTYTYNFTDGSVLPQNTSILYSTFVTSDGIVTMNSNSGKQFAYHDATHGAVFSNGNSFDFVVAGNATITLTTCTYSAANSWMVFRDAQGDSLGAIRADNNGGTDGLPVSFNYTGASGVITGTLVTSGSVYLHGLSIANANVTAQAGKTYTYNLTDGSVLPQNTSITYSTFETSDGIVTMNSNSGKQFAYHDATHGAVFSNGNSFNFVVAGNATITLTTCTYSAANSWMVFRDAQGDSLGAIRADNNGGTDGLPVSFNYTGASGVITGTLVASGSVYLHALSIANANAVTAQPGKTYTYNLADGSVLPQNTTIKYSSFVTSDGIVTMKSNTGNQFSYHDATHGTVFSNGNSFDFVVAGNATITLTTCTYSAADSWMVFKDAQGDSLGAIRADNNGGTDGFARNFSYTGAAGVVTGTLVTSGSVYLHALSIQNAAAAEPSNGKIDVWDFGAEQLDTATYNNKLNDTTINSWYDSSDTVGSDGNVLPSSFTAGDLSWVGGSNDRLRTTNTNLTRYDENISGVTDYTGRIYVNATAATGRYMSLTLDADDIVTVDALSQNGTGRLNFQYVPDPSYQTDQKMLASDVAAYKFVAKKAGVYHIFDDKDKPSYYRIYRQHATYDTVSGKVDTTQASGIPNGYGINFENKAGKVWDAVVKGDTAYSVTIPAGYTYSLSLTGANGFVISNGDTLAVTDTTSSYNITVKKVQLYTVSGSITGLDSTNLSNLSMKFTADPTAHTVYVPSPVIDDTNSTYSVQLQPAINYTVTAQGVNDYYIPDSTITIGQKDSAIDIGFTAKPVYHIKLNVTGLTTEEETHLKTTFTNLNESGYVYSFDSIDSVNLRNGTYSISYSGLDDYPVKLRLTSYLKVEEDTTSKDMVFNPVIDWSFDDKPISGSSYEGLLFTGSVSSEVAKGHLLAKPGATIKVPVKPGDKIGVTYYYSADFTIGSTEYSTSSGSTSKLEYANYTYPGDTNGYVTIKIDSSASTTYLPDINIGGTIPYQSVIYVGADKTYKTINDALAAIAKMNRTIDQRVTVMIDPGNYEEMLTINVPNVTLENAAAHPTTGLTNEGVDITSGAVRITSYYGDGYNYYSMGSNQKWNADVLRVDKENGSLSYTNTGAGTTNGSYWNATVVVNAQGFQADNIIFENSFNQYISKKESEDVVVPWTTGSPGVRPTDYGDVSVQNRSLVERACALAFTSSGDKAMLKKCRIVGRQDALYGGTGARVVFNRCIVMGDVDYTFGAMIAVFYKSDMVMNTSDASNDAAYLTAAQQSSGRGYLMYKCEVKSPIPGIETASTYYSKPGYFGRPWQATTSEVVFYKTTIDTSSYPGSEGKSMIVPIGWNNSLGGESNKMYEYGTIELSGVDNSANRASWSTVLTQPVLSDGTKITTFNFTKGTDNWDPLPVETDTLTVSTTKLGVKATDDTVNFDISSDVEWTVSSDQSWLKVKGVGYGVDSSNIVVTATQNTTSKSRTATITVYGDNVGAQTITVTQAASSTTGINEIPKNSFTIYPNPSNGGTIVVKRQQAGPGTLVIMNSVGQVVYRKKLEFESESISLPVQPGLYIVVVDGQTEKLLIR